MYLQVEVVGDLDVRVTSNYNMNSFFIDNKKGFNRSNEVCNRLGGQECKWSHCIPEANG